MEVCIAAANPVNDVSKEIIELIAERHKSHNKRNGDDGNNQYVYLHRLTTLACGLAEQRAKETEHNFAPEKISTRCAKRARNFTRLWNGQRNVRYDFVEKSLQRPDKAVALEKCQENRSGHDYRHDKDVFDRGLTGLVGNSPPAFRSGSIADAVGFSTSLFHRE